MKTIILFAVRILFKIGLLTPIRVARLKFFYKLHRWPDFEHPKDINEKINWLKFYGDTSKWSLLADKYAVRGYLESIGYGDLLVGLYGKWDNVDDIDWDSLPDRFVMKINSGCGDVVICRDKSKLDKVKVMKHFNQAMSEGWGDLSGEPHYSLIKSCVIAEELLDASTQPCSSGSMVDYKIWCFAGVPKYIACCYNREGFRLDHAIFDTDWHYHPEWAEYTAHCRKPEQLLPRPVCLDRMLEIAGNLTKEFPAVRLDMYEVNGKVYFGEFTFTSNGGYMDNYSKEFLTLLGDSCHLY